jgi:uncharacterized membrane protein YsdA (DUF1294 family)
LLTKYFLSIGYDKFLAKNQKKNSERTLLSFVFLGGTIGSGIAMLLLDIKQPKKAIYGSFGYLLLYKLDCFFLVFF